MVAADAEEDVEATGEAAVVGEEAVGGEVEAAVEGAEEVVDEGAIRESHPSESLFYMHGLDSSVLVP